MSTFAYSPLVEQIIHAVMRLTPEGEEEVCPLK